MYKYKGYTIKPSTRQHKKYMALIDDGTWVHFGDNRYEHFHDKLGHYNHLNHNNQQRRDAYKARHGAKDDHTKVGTPAWFSWHILW